MTMLTTIRVFLGLLLLGWTLPSCQGFAWIPPTSLAQLSQSHQQIPTAASLGQQAMAEKQQQGAGDLQMPSTTPIVPWRADPGEPTRWMDLSSAMAENRIITIDEYLSPSVANYLIGQMLHMLYTDPMQDIKLYILKFPGADLRAALALYDLLLQAKESCTVMTTNLGWCSGILGALLCSAGSKGMRAALPQASFLLSPQDLRPENGREPVYGSASHIVTQVRQLKRSNQQLQEELALWTGQSLAKIQKDMQRDFYLSSNEAVRYGLIDKVHVPDPSKRHTTRRSSIDDVDDFVDLGVFGGNEEQRYQPKPEPKKVQELETCED